jgi:hypothetical protein
MAFQERYIAYANEHGKTPEEMLEFDRNLFPGGVMGGFLTWHPREPKWLRKDQVTMEELPF